MRNIIGLSLFGLILCIWLFPIIIAFITWNFWYIMLYIVWWVPAYILTNIIIAIVELID
jgi:hypothetical protein